MLIGARAAADAMLDNVRFIRADARMLLKKVPTETADEVGILFPAPQPTANGGFADVLQPPIAADISRVLETEGTFEFASDSKPYFSVKMRMLGGLGIFTCDINDVTQENELTAGRDGTARTRYQDVWEKKGIITHRAKLHPVK